MDTCPRRLRAAGGGRWAVGVGSGLRDDGAEVGEVVRVGFGGAFGVEDCDAFGAEAGDGEGHGHAVVVVGGDAGGGEGVVRWG